MATLQLFLFSVRSLRSNRLRSLLSVSGIVIGAFTITFVGALGNGVDRFLKEQLSFLSATSIFVEPSSASLSSSKLKEGDLDRVLDVSKNLLSGTPMSMGRATVAAGNESEPAAIIGTAATFPDVMKFSVRLGTYFSPGEVAKSEKVVVLWPGLAEKLFGRTDVVGEWVTVARKRFRVVGIMADTPSLSGFSFDDAAYVPHTAATRFVTGDAGNAHVLVFLAKSPETVSAASLEITAALRKFHGIREGEPDDFNVYEQKAMVSAINLVTKAFTYLIVGVALLILVVSGIGIMNVMYASVAERTRDIGVMRAVGARKSDVVFQFVSESVVLSAFAATVGILLAEATVFAANSALSEFQFVRGNSGDVFALAFTISVSLVFGIAPAVRASRLDMVEALK